MIKLAVHEDERGELVSLENSKDVPFQIKRVFYIFNVKQNAKRAQHANMVAQELVICLKGSCEVRLDDGKEQKVTIPLSCNSEALHIYPKTWLEISNFSDECLLLALSDHHYNRNHQIRDYQTFSEAVQ